MNPHMAGFFYSSLAHRRWSFDELFFICDGFMQATLILDNKAVKTKVFADNHDVDDLIKKCKAMVRRYDGYPFIQIKNTTYYDDKIVYDLHTFNHQSSVLEIDFN